MRADRSDVVGIAGQHIMLETHRDSDEMGVDDVRCRRARQQASNGWTVIEWMHCQGLDYRREACLPGAVTPDLREDGMRSVKRGIGPSRSEENLRRILAPVHGDQDAGVEDHRP
ncbi:hypothetical protein [Candidatus Poriferisodalis sp.]|uniref:hypothetical protein n=1 Tax=Candidatus Poriferisodalis sp. TaxID=3101277 RepID=UPI003B52C9D3